MRQLIHQHHLAGHVELAAAVQLKRVIEQVVKESHATVTRKYLVFCGLGSVHMCEILLCFTFLNA